MKNKKNFVIGILVVVIVILIIMLLFCGNFIKHIMIESADIYDEISDENSVSIDNDALFIAMDLFNNKTVRTVFDNYNLNNILCSCGKGQKIFSSDELGLSNEGVSYCKSLLFSSYDEYIDQFKSYFSNDYIENYLKDKVALATASKTINDKIYYIFYESNNNLYCALSGKGSNVNRVSFSNLKLNILSKTDSEIEVLVNVKWLDSLGNVSDSEKANMKIIKDGTWKIDSYVIQ